MTLSRLSQPDLASKHPESASEKPDRNFEQPEPTSLERVIRMYGCLVESCYDGSKNSGNPPITDAVFQSLERNLKMAIAEICL